MSHADDSDERETKSSRRVIAIVHSISGRKSKPWHSPVRRRNWVSVPVDNELMLYRNRNTSHPVLVKRRQLEIAWHLKRGRWPASLYSCVGDESLGQCLLSATKLALAGKADQDQNCLKFMEELVPEIFQKVRLVTSLFVIICTYHSFLFSCNAHIMSAIGVTKFKRVCSTWWNFWSI